MIRVGLFQCSGISIFMMFFQKLSKIQMDDQYLTYLILNMSAVSNITNNQCFLNQIHKINQLKAIKNAIDFQSMIDSLKVELQQFCNYLINQPMNIQNIASQLKFVNRIGQTLSLEERVSLEVSVLKLKQEYKYQTFYFWGRVEGVLKNYYIVQGVNFKGANHFPISQYFWSSEDFKFGELPSPRSEYTAKVNKIDDYFTGQHEKILFKSSGENTKALNVGGQEYFVKSKNFTELDRLSIIVSQIEKDCQVVPVGAFKMIPTHELILNPNFRGLKIEQSKNLDNYVHLRAPNLPDKKLLIESDKALQREDFLDPLSQDPIKKCWSLQTDESKTEITLRNLIWNGYLGYHRTNSSIFGGVYIGNGIKSQDLAFII